MVWVGWWLAMTKDFMDFAGDHDDVLGLEYGWGSCYRFMYLVWRNYKNLAGAVALGW